MHARRLVLVLAVHLCGTACTRHSQERQALIDFFAAARLRDATVLSNMGSATFEPRRDGVVQQFDIERVEAQEPRVDGGRTIQAKNVTIAAQVRTPDGDVVAERMVVTFEQPVGGRWTITQLRASRISPAASSVPPN